MSSNRAPDFRRHIIRDRLVSIFVPVTFILATIQFVRSYFIVAHPYLDIDKYQEGMERTPYQSRMLMAVIMRLAHSSPHFSRIASHLGSPLGRPEVFAEFLVGLLSMAIIAAVVQLLYRHVSPTGRLAYMPYALVLWMASATYIVRFERIIYFPYDLLAAALFTLCIWLCFCRRYLMLLPAFSLACFNRETVIMIVPLVLINLFAPDRSGGRLKLKWPSDGWKEIATAIVMIAVWLPIFIHFKNLYAANPTELGSRIPENTRLLLHPQTWPQIASGCGFLMPIPFIFWGSIENARLRIYALLIPMWVAVMFAFGLLPESRIFGELIALLAVLCTVIFERTFAMLRV